MTDSALPLRLTLPDGSLRIDFQWCEDRYVQQLLLADGSMVSSIEGDADQSSPPSPPLQQLSRETIEDTDVILGVGAAGRNHWSISIETTAYQERHALKFDVACRCKSTPAWLGSSYRTSDRLRIVALDGSSLVEKDGIIEVRPLIRDSDTVRWGYLIFA